MEIKICECGSFSTSEDLLTNEITCLKCGKISKGEMVDFLGVKEGEKIIKHSPRFKPFDIQTRIKRFNDPGLLSK
jgi:transcription initiation factor TFIIIB Brf1 subunit/transcription initiation factor TFIIB